MDDLNPLAGTANMLEEVDSEYMVDENCSSLCVTPMSDIYILEKLMVLLRDGRTLIGYLRSVDQFANLVLHRTIERIHVGNEYGDIPRGVFIIRGENVVLLGEIVSINISDKCKCNI